VRGKEGRFAAHTNSVITFERPADPENQTPVSGYRLRDGGGVRLSELTEQLAATVNVREHAVVVADSPGEVVRVAFATIESHSIFERICVLEDLRDRLPKIVLAVPSRHVANVGTKIVHFKVLIANRALRSFDRAQNKK
jgi:hypothetical protein